MSVTAWNVISGMYKNHALRLPSLSSENTSHYADPHDSSVAFHITCNVSLSTVPDSAGRMDGARRAETQRVLLLCFGFATRGWIATHK
jgi:hypothetical protein